MIFDGKFLVFYTQELRNSTSDSSCIYFDIFGSNERQWFSQLLALIVMQTEKLRKKNKFGVFHLPRLNGAKFLNRKIHDFKIPSLIWNRLLL
jgi:hypothetical protein